MGMPKGSAIEGSHEACPTADQHMPPEYIQHGIDQHVASSNPWPSHTSSPVGLALLREPLALPEALGMPDIGVGDQLPLPLGLPLKKSGYGSGATSVVRVTFLGSIVGAGMSTCSCTVVLACPITLWNSFPPLQ